MDWRSWLKSERSLLAQLALMLAVMLVVGVYFLERLETGLQADQRRHLQALAQYLAADSGDYLAADNRVSLGVIARQAAGLETVAAVEVRDTSGRTLAHAGPRVTGPAPIQEPITPDTGSPVGRIQIWPDAPARVQRRVESGFVLVVLLLLALRVLGEVIRRRLWPAARGLGAGPTTDEAEPEATAHAPAPRAEAHLWVRTPDAEGLRARYTPSLVNRVLADYQRLLEDVARYHGARLEASLNEPAHLVFAAPSPGEAVFQALCAGELVLCSAHRLADRGQPKPGLQLVISLADDVAIARALDLATDTDRIYVPAASLDEAELAERIRSADGERVTVEVDGRNLTLQGVDRLSGRYEQLITAQAQKLVPRSA